MVEAEQVSDEQGSVDAQAHITAYWDVRSATYDTRQSLHSNYGEAERALWRDILHRLLPPPPADVLDVGTGTGFLALLLAELGYRVTGIDPSAGMLAVAREKAAHLSVPPVFRLGDGHAPPFPDGSFDGVVSRHVLWTLREPTVAFAAWYRLLRPGGRVLAFDSPWFAGGGGEPRGCPWEAAWAEHYSDAVRARLPLMMLQTFDPVRALFEAAGFTEVRISRLEELERAEAALPRDSASSSQVTARYVLTGVRSA